MRQQLCTDASNNNPQKRADLKPFSHWLYLPKYIRIIMAGNIGPFIEWYIIHDK